MKKKQSILLVLFILFSGLLGAIVQADSQAATESFEIQAHAALAIDVDSGKILYAKNADEQVGIASITKIIGLYLVQKAVAQGDLTWQEPVEISLEVAKLSQSPELSNVPLEAGHFYSVKELFDSAAIQSANASMVALAEKIAGSEAAFVDQMKEQLKIWGIQDPFLVNSSGLNNEDLIGDLYPGSSDTDENKLSAKAVAIIARHLIQDYPEYLEVASIPSQVFGESSPNPTTMYNTNWMLPGFLYENQGVVGLKTGTTDFAGACFVSVFEQDGHTFITVILNADQTLADPGARFVETQKLFEYIASNWRFESLALNNESVPKLDSLPVFHGKQGFVSIKTKQTVQIWVPTKTTNNELTYKVALEDALINSRGKLVAPLTEDEIIGTLTLSSSNDLLGYLEPADEQQNAVEVVTTEAVKKTNFFIRIIQSIFQLFEK
ncbi:serine hydrolase [Enterococcus lemanii]|uniref:serine-type D-Ala-D-Ala carboxypeptidase n=1 Tax=Enterococcus lemanii TaxID=1159752 RepID=A0ABV9MYV6_9ENTE|nr:serine hydrolase [Enterococcus lemanii]MBM7708775.1 D-alanyl-D-alanine carboxypeptidase (penicillin-binding protein 5/6) [Enterococcus lemanii]